MADQLILTTVYDRRLLIHLHDDCIHHVRVISNSQYPIGTIALGRVCKMIPSSEACFVDIGDNKQYFLTIPSDLHSITFADGKKHDKLHCEDVILVQVSSEAIKTKAPSVTTNISLTGQFVVIEPGKGISFSKKLDNLTRKTLVLPENIDTFTSKYHIIIRTEAKQASDPVMLGDELSNLFSQMENVYSKASNYPEKKIIYQPAGLVETTIRDWSKFGIGEIITDELDTVDDLKQISQSLNNPIKVTQYTDDNLALYKLYKLESLLDTCLSQKVYLKSGGFLVVEQGETLTAIDVNSAHAISGNKEESSLKLNLEAAEAISIILKNRNISGMILVDFINMKEASNEKIVIDTMKGLLAKDDVRALFVDMTGLGLMEITRQRIYRSLSEQWTNETKRNKKN